MRELKLFNGRPYGILPKARLSHGNQTPSINICAYSMADARRVCLECGLNDPGSAEIKNFFSRCWGNDMAGITPERGVWVTSGYGADIKRMRIPFKATEPA